MTDTDMLTLIGGENRAATQFSAIRRYEKIAVNAVRQGRKVIAYEIPVYQKLAEAEVPDGANPVFYTEAAVPDAK